MTQSPPPGWYTDPANATGMRWWDGSAWSMSTQPTAPEAVAAQPVPQPVAGAAPTFGVPTPPGQYSAQGYGQAPWSPSGRTVTGGGNRGAYTTFGFSALYIVLAITTHFVIIGFVPLLMAFRSFQAKEKLAPIAIAVAIVTVVVSVATLSGH